MKALARLSPMQHDPPEPPPLIAPRRGTLAVAVQPHYGRWESVRVGMTRNEVAAILGEPLTGREMRPMLRIDPRWPPYGFISYPALPDRWAMLFEIHFDGDDRVAFKCDPFGGEPLSRDGTPSRPRLIAPAPASRFSPYARVLDVRWFPCSGVYPLTYDLELGFAPPGTGAYQGWVEPQQYGQPYAVLDFPGSQPGRVRVRGRNARGVGPWSEYRHFTFEGGGG